LKLSLDDYSMQTVAGSVAGSTRSLARAKAIEVKRAFRATSQSVVGIERRLTQVLLKIVGNAIKFTDTGSVQIRVNALNGQFTIADTGLDVNHRGVPIG